MMYRSLILTLTLAGCSTPMGPPPHPIAGSTWQGQKTLTLTTTEYTYDAETGHWTAGSKEFRYKGVEGKEWPQERCNLSYTGRLMVLSDCRLAGRYTRMD
jgi:hypothetical protein